MPKIWKINDTLIIGNRMKLKLIVKNAVTTLKLVAVTLSGRDGII